MAKKDWVSCKVHVKMAEAIDRFLETDIAKKNAIMSRSDFLAAVLRNFFSEYDTEYGIFTSRNFHNSLKRLEQKGYIVKEQEPGSLEGLYHLTLEESNGSKEKL